ncbi:MAG: TIGR02996 domain-containing protein [Planctomycetia bacterium]|nr:TIGR02996 domain-containing protein [Planctomycetia bacterium]
MNEESAFIGAIVESPDDDTLRLVFADWLEENGQPERAEFIRIECEQASIRDDGIAPNEWDSPRFWELQKRAEELYKRHAGKWFGELFKAHRGEMNTRRGFPYHVALTARKFIDCGEALFRAAPTIEDVFIGRLGRNMPEFARCPALGHVRQLTFFETPFWTAEAEEFAQSPYLGNLREFKIPYTDTQIGPRGAAALANAKSLRQLQHLNLYNHAIFDEGAEKLLTSKRLATLTSLDLGNNGLTDETALALYEADHLKLTSLDLMYNHLSRRGMMAFADSKHLAGLEYLSLQGNPIEYIGARYLAQEPFLSRLQNLRLGDCELDDEGVAVILGAAWPKLTELYLALNVVGKQSAQALAGNRSLGHVETLSVVRCEIGPTVAKLLGRVSLPSLRDLDAAQNPLGPKGVRGLLAGPLVRFCRHLDIGQSELGDEGAEVVARSSALANVKWLDLGNNRITARGAIALAESRHLEGVQLLDLSDNKIGKKGRDALNRRFGDRVRLDD